MTTTRKQYSPKFKARVAMEAIRGEKTLSQLGSQFKVHPIQIAKWRKAALEQLPELFVDGRTRKGRNGKSDSDALYAEIGRLKVELDWLKKKSACSIEEMRPLVERDHPVISVRRQCELLGSIVPVVLRTSGREHREPPDDAIAGRAVHTDAVLWKPENDRVAGDH